MNDDFIFYCTILNYSTTQTTHVVYPKPNLYLNAIYFREYCTYNKVCCIQHYQGVINRTYGCFNHNPDDK